MNDLNKNNAVIDINSFRKRAVEKELVIVICGPTCTGKTKLALKLAEVLSTDIISVDSMQIYSGMDIGTDKYKTELYGIKQYMVDIVNPDINFTVFDFQKICRKIIRNEFFNKKRIPLLAGGSGLYIRAVVDNLGFTPGAESGKDREKMESEKTEELYLKLKKIDPVYADKISNNDRKRILRGLEVYEKTGKTFSSYQTTWNLRKSIYNTVFIGITADRNIINSCIEKRVDNMLKLGLIEEARNLAEKGYDKYNSLKQAVGYKEVIGFLDGLSSLEECRAAIISGTKKLVKKQFTWFKADPRINWINTDSYGSIAGLAEGVLNIINKQF